LRVAVLAMEDENNDTMATPSVPKMSINTTT
jgi:hypothetical protein